MDLGKLEASDWRSTVSQDDQPNPTVLDLYKLSVEMADRVSARRGTANAFFLSAQTAMVSVLGLAQRQFAQIHWVAYLAISLAGVVMSLSWWLQLRSYRDLNAAKFSVINNIEKVLPVKMFTEEWEALKRDPLPPLRRRYAELGLVERVVPFVFAALYMLLFAARVAS
ncbi:RipA family octameric membrane protein [Streptomyces lydicamycinicus]